MLTCIPRATVSAVFCLVVPAFICIDLLISRVLKINDDDDADDNSRRRDTGRTIFKLAEDTIIVLYGLQTDYDCSADRINAHKSELKPVGWLVWCRTDHCSVKAPLAISTAQTTL